MATLRARFNKDIKRLAWIWLDGTPGMIRRPMVTLLAQRDGTYRVHSANGKLVLISGTEKSAMLTAKGYLAQSNTWSEIHLAHQNDQDLWPVYQELVPVPGRGAWYGKKFDNRAYIGKNQRGWYVRLARTAPDPGSIRSDRVLVELTPDEAADLCEKDNQEHVEHLAGKYLQRGEVIESYTAWEDWKNE